MLRLPRKSVRSHFGFEPQGGVGRQRTRASRLLFDLIRNADMEAASSSADFYMQLAIYDLVGALFAPTDPRPISRSADKLFARICGVVKDGLPDPDFGPAQVASERGFRCDTSRSFSPSAARPAANSSIRTGSIMPHIFSTAGL